MPEPRKGESQDDFISRCMDDDVMRRDYPEEDQRAAVCHSQWERKDNGAENMKRITVRMADDSDMPEKKTGEVLIYDVIGADLFGGVSAKDFADTLDGLGQLDEIVVRINSPGGDVFDGNAIYNALVRHEAPVRVEIDGLAASAASYIAMAGDEINIAENAMMMIHLGQGMVMGDKRDMRKIADTLDKIDNQIADVYAARTGRKSKTFMRLMEDETWFTAEEAVTARLADKMRPNKERATAHFSREVLNKLWHDEQRIAAFGETAEEKWQRLINETATQSVPFRDEFVQAATIAAAEMGKRAKRTKEAQPEPVTTGEIGLPKMGEPYPFLGDVTITVTDQNGNVHDVSPPPKNEGPIGTPELPAERPPETMSLADVQARVAAVNESYGK